MPNSDNQNSSHGSNYLTWDSDDSFSSSSSSSVVEMEKVSSKGPFNYLVNWFDEEEEKDEPEFFFLKPKKLKLRNVDETSSDDGTESEKQGEPIYKSPFLSYSDDESKQASKGKKDLPDDLISDATSKPKRVKPSKGKGKRDK